MTAVLNVSDLHVRLAGKTILSNISLDVMPGEILAVTGESGSGKSTLARALMGLLPPSYTVAGSITLERQELLVLSERQLCNLRGNRIGMVFQEPMTALNPIRSIGKQVADTLRLHRRLSRQELARESATLLDSVGLGQVGISLDAHAHTLSGGQRQRVLLAMALACQPAVLVADEFTTALDATTQASILELVTNRARDHGMSIILISHDLGLIRQYARRTLIMRQGRQIEMGLTEEVFTSPQHPYTKVLLDMSLYGTPRPPLTRIPVNLPSMSGSCA